MIGVKDRVDYYVVIGDVFFGLFWVVVDGFLKKSFYFVGGGIVVFGDGIEVLVFVFWKDERVVVVVFGCLSSVNFGFFFLVVGEV